MMSTPLDQLNLTAAALEFLQSLCRTEKQRAQFEEHLNNLLLYAPRPTKSSTKSKQTAPNELSHDHRRRYYNVQLFEDDQLTATRIWTKNQLLSNARIPLYAITALLPGKPNILDYSIHAPGGAVPYRLVVTPLAADEALELLQADAGLSADYTPPSIEAGGAVRKRSNLANTKEDNRVKYYSVTLSEARGTRKPQVISRYVWSKQQLAANTDSPMMSFNRSIKDGKGQLRFSLGVRRKDDDRPLEQIVRLKAVDLVRVNYDVEQIDRADALARLNNNSALADNYRHPGFEIRRASLAYADSLPPDARLKFMKGK